LKTEILDIPYQTDVKILGLKFTKKVNVSANENWSTVTSRVRALAQDTYHRDLSLDRRIHFAHTYVLARLWYIAQIFPPPAEAYDSLTPQCHGSSGEGKSSGFPYPLFNVGDLMEDGTL